MWYGFKTELRIIRDHLGDVLVYFLAVPAVFWCLWNLVTGSIPRGACIINGWCPSRSWDMVAAPVILLIYFYWTRVFDWEDSLHLALNNLKCRVFVFEVMNTGWGMGLIGGVVFFLIPNHGLWLILRAVTAASILSLVVGVPLLRGQFLKEQHFTQNETPTKIDRLNIGVGLMLGVMGGLFAAIGVVEKGLVWTIRPFVAFLLIEGLIVFSVWKVQAFIENKNVQALKA